MAAVFTSDVVLAHFAALSGLIKKLSDPENMDKGEYSLDHLDAVGALLACASVANRIKDGPPFDTMSSFMRFCDMCEHIASSLRLDIPQDKCIHQIAAFVVTQIMEDTGGLPDDGVELYGDQKPTIN